MKKILWVATVLLAACGGAGGGGPAPIPSAPIPAPTQTLTPNGGMQKVAITLVVPLNSGTTGIKHRAYISASAMGAGIVVTQGSTIVNATLDLSSSSSACTGSGTSRTCTTTVGVPFGSDAFTVTVYNESPVNNAIPSGAAILGVGTSTVNVIAGTTTSVQVFVGGQVAHFGAALPSGAMPANGHAQSAVLVIAPTDFGNNPITAGANDPYANPITVSLTETGGSGNASLSLNGGAASSSVQVTKSTDAVSVNYNGNGAPGYAFTIALSASGVSSQSSTVAPLIAAVSGHATTSISLNGSAVGAQQLGFGEAGSSSSYTATLGSGCASIATKGSISGSGASATLPVTGGTAPSASGCTLTISDGTISLVLPVTNTPVSHSVTINGTQITEYSGYSHPFGITKGPDGNMWFTDQGNSTIYAINPANESLVYNYLIIGSDLFGITTGSDGALWASDQGLSTVDRVTTAGVITQYPFPSCGCPEGITSDSSGQNWVMDNTDGSVWTLSVGGQFAQAVSGLSFSTPTNSITVGPDGAIWWAGDGNIGRYNPADNMTQEIPVPNSGSVVYLAAGPDGAIWYTANASSPAMFVGRIPMNGDGPTFDTSATFPVNVAQPSGAQMAGITAGADNAMWFVVSNNTAEPNYIGEISLSGTITTFPIPTSAAGAWEIARGPDGSLWFTERNNGQIGHVIP